MDMENVGLYLLIWVKVFLLVKAQVTFNPDGGGDVQLKQTILTPPVNITTVQYYSSSPKFRVQYVKTDNNEVVFDIRNASVGSAIPEKKCETDQCQYRLRLMMLQFFANPELVGGTFKLKTILDNNEQNSTLSRTTYTFPAQFNLTGSESAVLNFPFTWTCHVTSGYHVVQWNQGTKAVGQAGILSNGSCSGNSLPTYSYILNCQNVSTYTLTIPGADLTKDLEGSIWRCINVSNESLGSKFMKLIIVYPPTVSVDVQNTTENTRNHTIICRATGGKPDNATIVALQQRIGSTFIRNITSFTKPSPGNITLTIPTVSYQDMGTYTCLASNGIPDRNNQKIQSGMAYLNVNTSAKFEMIQYTVRSDIDTQAVVKIPFYRNPPATESDVVWTKNTGSSNETVVSSANVSLSLNDADVNQTFHGVDVTLKGQHAIMTITFFQNHYEGNYTLKIKSGHTMSSEVAVILMRSGPPDTPSDFKVLTSKVFSIVLTWNKGSDGGHPQTFVILYKEKTAEVYTRKQVDDTTINKTFTDEVKDLKPDTNYEFLLYSFNKKGNSTGHQTSEERTLKVEVDGVYCENISDQYVCMEYEYDKSQCESEVGTAGGSCTSAPVVSAPSSLNSGLVGGAAGGGVAVLAVIIVILVVVQRRRHQEGKGNDYNSRETLAVPPKRNDDNEDGLKDNPLYGGSPSGANTVQGASAAPGNPSVYAEVVKPKKKNPAKVNDDPPPIYAEVNKSSKKNAKGEQYQNMDGFQQTGSTDKKKAKENEQRGYKNKDGLFYMDVKFDQPPTRGKPTIRKEEPTGYAMIQFEESNAKPTPNNARDVEGGQ